MRIALIFLIANWINKASLRFGLKNLFTANLMGGGGVPKVSYECVGKSLRLHLLPRHVSYRLTTVNS